MRQDERNEARDDEVYNYALLPGTENTVIRKTHKGRSESVLDEPQYDPVRIMETVFDDLANFKGSPSERAVTFFCKQNQIIYSILTDEEKLWLIKILDKSKLLKRLVSQRGKKKIRSCISKLPFF